MYSKNSTKILKKKSNASKTISKRKVLIFRREQQNYIYTTGEKSSPLSNKCIIMSFERIGHFWSIFLWNFNLNLWKGERFWKTRCFIKIPGRFFKELVSFLTNLRIFSLYFNCWKGRKEKRILRKKRLVSKLSI